MAYSDIEIKTLIEGFDLAKAIEREDSQEPFKYISSLGLPV